MITYGSTTLTSYNSIVKTEVYYYKSTSATSLSGGSWSTTKPTWENGKYIWQKIRTVYEDGTHSESDPVNITGQQGATGTAAYSFKLNSSDSIIGKTKDGEYTIKKITFSATYKQGTGAVSAYNGRFKIESTTNGSTWKTEYTSSGDESSKAFTIPNDIIAIKCSLYQSSGTTVLLDIVTVPVVKDGVDAIGLRDSIPYYLASDKDTGITRLTQGWTRYRPQLTAEKKYLWVYYVSRYSEGTTEPELIEIKDDLVHFENNGDESPVESCVVDIEPVQDLNGYDHPWPAGGGVNKCSVDTLAVGGSNQRTVKTTIAEIPAGEYYISFIKGGNAVTNIGIQFLNASSRAIAWVTASSVIAGGSAITLSESAVFLYIYIGPTEYDNGETFSLSNIQIETGTAKTAYIPYSNICPITGWTGAKVTRCGKNLCPLYTQRNSHAGISYDITSEGIHVHGTASGSSYSWSSYSSYDDYPIHLNAGTYKVSIDEMYGDSAKNAYLVILGKTLSGQDIPSSTVHSRQKNRTLVLTEPTAIQYGIFIASGSTVDFTVKPQIELGSTATDYEPYSGQTYDITFPSESGTVYGGQLNVTTGELTVDRAMVRISDLSWYYSNDYGYFGTQRDVANIKNPTSATTLLSGLICSAYKSGAAAETGSQKVNGTIGVFQSRIRIRDENYGSDVNTWASIMGNETIVYPLATPQIYTLTPQEITMLCKENNIFADTGQTAISYYDNQTSTDPYVDYSATSAFEYSVKAYEATQPLYTKTYTGIIGTANTFADASFYFAKIHPTAYTSNYKVKMKIRVTAPVDYAETIDIQLGGYGSSFSSYDSYTTRTGSIGIYYVNLYRATQAGIETNEKGHAIGFGLRYSTNPTDANYKRDITVDILELDGCTIEMLDTPVKYADMDGTGSTNYTGYNELAVASVGQNATNNTNTHYTQYNNSVKAGTFGVKRYTLLMRDTQDTWVSFVNQANIVATTKTVSTNGHILGKLIYSAGGAEYASGANTSTVYDAYRFDFRYSSNCGTTLTTNKPVYLVGTVKADGLFYFDTTTWWTQTEPTSADNKVYIYVGMAYSNYQVWLNTENPAYQFYNGEFLSYDKVVTLKSISDLKETLEDQIDGKIETWCQSTDPSTAWTTTDLKNQHDGDLWYYTGESTSSYKNNTTYKYTASTNKWTAYSANTDLFDKIDNKTAIYYGEPTTVTSAEEGDYLVDATDGSSYRWNSGAWVKVSDYKSAIDAIEIGGKNLLRGTRTQDVSLGNYKDKVTATEETLFGCTVFTSSIRWSDIGFDFKKQILDRNLVKAGDSVTYSIWAKTDDTEPRNIYGVWVGSYYGGTTIAVLSSEWTQYSKTFVVTEEMLEATSAVMTRFECNTNCTEGKYIYWAAPKLERGTKATDWTPAPEDTEAEISALQEDLQAQIDEKIQTYYQSTNPASAWTTADIRATHDGDLWCYTGTTTSTYTKDNVYRYNASNNTWTTYSASGDLFDKVDGKTTVFYGKTTDTFTDVETGDYLVDATDGSSYRYDGSKWVKVTDYQAAIDSMSIGGRNLFVTASRFHPEENAFTTTSTSKDNHIENFDAKGGIYTVEPFKAGDVITLQAQSNLPWSNRHASDGTAPNTVGFWIQAYDTMEDARARRNLKRSRFLTNDLGENHTSFLHTFTVPQDDDGRYYNFRFNSYSDGTQSVTAKFWDLQLERGNKATSWSPALEDLQVNIEGAEKRNLLLNTQKKTYSGYTMYYDLSESGRQLQEGEVVTFSMKATVPADRKRWAIYNSGGYLAISQWEAIEPDGETAVIYTWTGVWKLYQNDEPVANDKLHVYIGTSGATSSVTVEWAKLERGNTMSTYSPAPEDINSSINAAQTTADEALAATQPISSKTFTGVIGTANDIANASLYFAKVHPTTYTDPWMVKMKIKASVPSDTNFRKTVDITIHGCRSNFISYDSIVANYNSNPIYYLNLYRATQAGIETNKKGHALGFGLRSATSPTDTNKKRTFEVDLLEVDGCTVDWIDTPVKYADMDGTGSTNYVGCTELGITSNGQNATNNGNTYDRIKYSTIKAAEAIARYNIIVGTSAGYKHLKSGTPWDITYPILYADAALNANATGSSNYLTIPFTVTTTQNMTLTPYKPVYIEGTLDGTTFTPIDTTPLTQTVPTSDNGHQYILLGSAYSTTAINLEAEHPIYQFQNGNFVTVAEAASRIGANAENLIKATYAVCSTAAGTNAKTADCTNFELYEGARIQVTFTNANTASAPTLDINNTGAKAIYINKTAASDTNLLLWTAGSKMEFVYDGTGWIAQNVPYALYGTCSTGASTAAKVVTCNEAVICKGTTISVNMTNTNTAADATLNVGSTVAKDIYANGAKLTTNSRFNWRANTTQKFVFDGQVWRMDDDSVKALATAYITEIDDDGIMVHPEDDDTSGWAISDAIQLFKNGISYIKLWIENNIPKIRIGKEDQGHIILDNDSVDIRNDDKVLASFGATSVIGDENDWHQTIAANQITFAKGNNTITYISPDKLYTINAEVADAFYISNYSIRNASDGKLVIGLRR